MTRIIVSVCLFVGLFVLSCNNIDPNIKKYGRPKICLTFDDGNINDMPGYSLVEWNNLILKQLKETGKQSIFFVYGAGMNNKRGINVLNTWNNAGHLIANHTYSHLSYDSTVITYDQFKQDFLKNDSFIVQFANYAKFFRFPYMNEGNTKQKRDDFRAFLKSNNYVNGYVTIDASDWEVNAKLLRRLYFEPDTKIEGYRQFYLRNTLERAKYYNDLAIKLTGRQICHTLLLHHNLTTALFLGDLIKMFKREGWVFVDVNEAYKDPIYKMLPQTVPAGQSLIWALAKENDRLKKLVRFPAEGGSYEQVKMDKLGL